LDAGASTVFSARPPYRSLGDSFYTLGAAWAPKPGISRGRGGGTVVVSPDRPALQLGSRPWQQRTVQTLSVDHAGPSIEAVLRLNGVSKASPGRLTGTVTNLGSEPLHQLKAQTYEGQAQLAEVISPGQTVDVNAALVGISVAETDRAKTLLPATEDEMVMFAAASRAFTAPGQIALVGTSTPPDGPRVGTIVNVTVVNLETTDAFLTGTGQGRLVAEERSLAGENVSVVDATAPPGVGAVSVRYRASSAPRDGRETGPRSMEIYVWANGTWRSLPLTHSPQAFGATSPVEDTEINSGLVRIRTRYTDDAALSAPGAQLVPREG
ncbi:MAG: hypothetical protein WKF86_09195, partial [Acidimicrobiales bacterium]